jgi:hypothetical protein
VKCRSVGHGLQIAFPLARRTTTTRQDTTRHDEHDYEQYGIKFFEQQRVQDKDASSWKYPGEFGRAGAWLKCTKRDPKIEDDVYGHTPASAFEPTAPKFVEVLAVDTGMDPHGEGRNARKSRAAYQQFVGTVRSAHSGGGRRQCQLKAQI